MLLWKDYPFSTTAYDVPGATEAISSVNTLVRQAEGYESTAKNSTDGPILRSVEATLAGS
jgi:hypothetical protein